MCGIRPQSQIILSEVWWSVNCQPTAADVGSLDLHSETTNHSVLFIYLFLSMCSLASVTLPSRLLNTARTLSIMVVPDSHPDKRRQRQWFIQGGRRRHHLEPPLSILSFCSWLHLPLRDCLHAFCSWMHPCLFALKFTPAHVCFREGTERRDVWNERKMIHLPAPAASCMSASACHWAFVLSWLFLSESIPLMRMEVYFNIALVTEME